MSRLNLGDLSNDDLIPIYACLPTFEQCSRIFQAFKTSVHPIVPICHLPSLERILIQFWTDYTFDTSGDTLALLLSIIYTGSISSSDEQDATLAVSVYRSYEQLLHKMAFPTNMSKATIPLLQSFMLVHTCRASQVEVLSSFGFLSPAVRAAQSLKLHIERSSIQEIDCQIRRRIGGTSYIST